MASTSSSSLRRAVAISLLTPGPEGLSRTTRPFSVICFFGRLFSESPSPRPAIHFVSIVFKSPPPPPSPPPAQRWPAVANTQRNGREQGKSNRVMVLTEGCDKAMPIWVGCVTIITLEMSRTSTPRMRSLDTRKKRLFTIRSFTNVVTTADNVIPLLKNHGKPTHRTAVNCYYFYIRILHNPYVPPFMQIPGGNHLFSSAKIETA